MFHNAELVCEASGGAGACGAFKMPELQIVLLGLVTFLYGFELLSLVTFSYGHELLGLVTFFHGYVLLGLDNLHGVQFERLGFVLFLGVSGLILFNNDCMIAVRFCCTLVCFASFCLVSCILSFCLSVVS